MTAWIKFVSRFQKYFRTKRIRSLTSNFTNLQAMRVCDLGGSLHFWEHADPKIIPKDLVLLNISIDGQSTSHNRASSLKVELYDGKHIPYPDKYFDLVHCNSVIEHVPLAERHGFVAELKRVAKNYWVQTPAFIFPIEPHFVFPFLHWLPRSFAKKLIPITPWCLLSRPTKERQSSYFDEVHICTKAEFRYYFKDAELVSERVMMIPKSYIAVHRER